MWLNKLIFLSLFLAIFCEDADTEEDTSDTVKLAEGEEKLSENILQVLEHFKQPDPVGLPGAEIPDPYPVPDMKQSLQFGTLYFKNTAVYGISKFRILYVDAEIGAMEVHAAMTIDVLQARGNYTMSTWLNRAQGPFTVDVTGLKVIARATLGVERDGKLRAQDIEIDLGFNTIAVNFENLGFFGGMFQGIINTVDESDEDTTERLADGEKKLSDNIMLMLDHFKQPDPVGLPGDVIPDPCPVADMKQSLSLGTLYFTNTNVYGISKLRILYVNAEVGDLEVTAALRIDTLQARGNYSITSWFGSSKGPFTVDITGLKILAKANVGVERDGKLKAQDIHVDISFSSIATNFQNLGFLGGMLQSLINNGGAAIFDSSLPSILKEVYPKARAEINKKLEEVAGDLQFPNSISPLDMVVCDLRNKVSDMKLDPYRVQDYNTSVSVFTIHLSNTWITGISSFQRVGNITLKMENNTAVADFEVGTQKLEGRTQWDIGAIGGLMNRAGTASFAIEYLSARIIVAQPLDTRKTPEFRDIDFDIGNIQIRWNGAGTIDYVIEFAVNVIPNLLRYQIMDALEGPLKERVQQELDKLNVDELIKQELPKVDQIQETGFKLSSLKIPVVVNEQYDEDEFFNF